MRHWVILLGVALLTTGCVGILDGESFVTATEHWKQAEDEAKDRLDQPVLLGVLGVEPGDISSFREDVESEEDEDEQDAEDRRETTIALALARVNDTAVADGEAQAWYYEFGDEASEGNRTTFFGIVIDADGDVLFSETNEEPILVDGAPVQEWFVDSDEAMEVARDNHPLWANLTNDDHANAALFGTTEHSMSRETGEDPDEQKDAHEEGNESEPGDPIWWLSAETADGNSSTVLVNGTTGEYLGEFSFDFGDFDFNWSFDLGPPQESGRFQDQVTIAEPTNEHGWELSHEGHPELRVQVTGDIPAGTVLNVTVTGPDDRSRSFTASGGPGDMSFEQPPVGGYAATVTLDEGIAQRYTLDWCAPGATYGPPGPPGATPSC